MEGVFRPLELEIRQGQSGERVPGTPTRLIDAFERVVVINLARRADRFSGFLKRTVGHWPFARPQRFEAIDGTTLKAPPTWDKGPGAWGCQLSHRAVLDSAIADGVSSLLVLEDDAYPVEDLDAQAQLFMDRVPDDWNCLMLGGEHLLPPVAVRPGVVRCTSSIRTHAYALRGQMMAMLSVFWKCNEVDHCDLVLSALMPHFKTYAPDPMLFGQDAGLSDVTPEHYPLRFFAPPMPVPPVMNPEAAEILSGRVRAADPTANIS